MSNRNNTTIKEAIQKIALHGHINNSTGAWRGTGRTTGYVVKIHSEEDDPLFGTVDVQEFTEEKEVNGVKVGYHEGVYLSSIQKNMEGYVIVPKLYSDVTIAQDIDSGNEYVVMFSHVDLIHLDSHEEISIGVREREEYDENDENSDEVEELKPTGTSTSTIYSKESITTTVTPKKDEPSVRQVMDKDGLRQVIGEDKSKLTMTVDDILLEHDKASMTLEQSNATLKTGQSSVTVQDGKVFVGNTSGTDDAVLGQQLASILSELMGYLGQMMTPTMMGPQPPANVLGSFISLKSKIQAFASSHSGFLTQKVQIQK